MVIFGFHIIDLAVIGVYMIGITILGMYMARRVKTVGDFFLGGRKFGKIMTIARDFGIGTSAEDPVIVVGKSYQLGLSGIWYTLVQIFSTPFYWITKPWFRRLRIFTTGDLCLMRFGKEFAYFYSVYSAITLSVLLGLVLKSASAAIVGMSGGQIHEATIVISMALLFILYGAFGGQHAAVITDFFQAFFIIILSTLLIPFSIIKAGGISAIREIPDQYLELMTNNPESEITLAFIIAAVLASLMAAMGNPTMGTVISKTEWETRIGMTAGNMLKRLCTVAWAFSGVFFLAVTTDITNPDEVFGAAVSQVLPIGCVGLMAACIMAAAMSTCSGLMVITGSYVIENFYNKIRPDKGDKHYLFAGRLTSVVFAAVGVFCALSFPSIVSALKYIWVLPTFVGIAIWLALGWRRANRWGAWATVIVTLPIQTVCKFYFGLPFATTLFIYLPIGFATMIIVSCLTPREPQEKLDEFYALLHTPIGQEDKLKYAEVKILHH